MSPVDKVYLETRLRNLKRSYAKMFQHADLLDETRELGKEIQDIENKLNSQ